MFYNPGFGLRQAISYGECCMGDGKTCVLLLVVGVFDTYQFGPLGWLCCLGLQNPC